MTDHLEAARNRLSGLYDHLSRREVALAADDLDAILSAILDHLEAQQTDASIRRGLDDAAQALLDASDALVMGHKPDGVSTWQWLRDRADELGIITLPLTEQLGRFADDPEPDLLDESNHADRIDRYGDQWVWCDGCGGFMYIHGMHMPGWTAAEIDKGYGPLTFAQ